MSKTKSRNRVLRSPLPTS